MRTIVEAASKEANKKPGSAAQQIGDLYDSFMDEKKLDELGLTPLKAEFDRVDALKSAKDIPSLIAHFNRVGVSSPYDIQIHLDNKDSTKYVVDFEQSGLGLPDRDYYLNKDGKMKEARSKYEAFITKMLTLKGDTNPAAKAKEIVAFETKLAKIQWTKVQLRDPVKAYNKESFAMLAKLTPGYGWKSYMADASIEGKVDYVIVGQPSYLKGFAKLVASTPLPVWKDYFTFHVLTANARLLSKAYNDENFCLLRYGPQWRTGTAATLEARHHY